MKRFLSIMLCAILLFSFTACGSKSEANSDVKETSSKVTKESVETTTKQKTTEKTEESTTVAETKTDEVKVFADDTTSEVKNNVEEPDTKHAEEKVETPTEQEVTEAPESPTTIVETKSDEIDFSNAKKIYVGAVTPSSRSSLSEFAKEFGVKEYKLGDKIDLKEYESFNNLDASDKYAISTYWNGKNVDADDYVVTNEIGDGYFKIDCSSIRLYVLYVAL